MVNEATLKEDIFFISAKRLRSVNNFWLGFIIYSLGYVIGGGQVSFKVTQPIQAIGLVLLLPAAISLIQLKFKNDYLRIIFIIYYIWLLNIISKGIHLDFISVKDMFLNADFGIVIYLVPLIVFFPKNLHVYKKIFDAILILGIFFIIFDIVFVRALLDRSFATQNIIEYLSKSLSIPCGFILLTYKYHSNKKVLFSLALLLISLLLSIYKARRGLSFICLSILVFSFVIYYVSTKKKLLVIYLSFFLMISGILYASSLYNVGKNGLFSLLAERASEDTRSLVEVYFYGDMKKKDWIVGKGINGEYFCPDIDENQVTNNRSYIETGYLQIILKGGFVSLGLYLLITIPAILLGIFYSKNILSKAAGIWIFISLISSYPATMNTFYMHFLLVWISVGICYSKAIRRIPDDDLVEFFNDSSQYVEK